MNKRSVIIYLAPALTLVGAIVSAVIGMYKSSESGNVALRLHAMQQNEAALKALLVQMPEAAADQPTAADGILSVRLNERLQADPGFAKVLRRISPQDCGYQDFGCEFAFPSEWAAKVTADALDGATGKMVRVTWLFVVEDDRWRIDGAQLPPLIDLETPEHTAFVTAFPRILRSLSNQVGGVAANFAPAFAARLGKDPELAGFLVASVQSIDDAKGHGYLDHVTRTGVWTSYSTNRLGDYESAIWQVHLEGETYLIDDAKFPEAAAEALITPAALEEAQKLFEAFAKRYEGREEELKNQLRGTIGSAIEHPREPSKSARPPQGDAPRP